MWTFTDFRIRLRKLKRKIVSQLDQTKNKQRQHITNMLNRTHTSIQHLNENIESIKKQMKEKTDRWLVLVYWVLAISSIIWGNYVIKINWFNDMFPAGQVAWRYVDWLYSTIAYIGNILIILFVSLWAKYDTFQGNRIFFISYIPLLLGGIFGVTSQFCGVPESRTLFTVIFSATATTLSYMALYFEPTNNINPANARLIHQRYLQYTNSVIWAVGFLLIGYVGWEYYRSQLVKTNEFVPVKMIGGWTLVGFAQLFFTIGCGLLLMVYSLTKKMAVIESTLQNQETAQTDET